MQNISVRLTRRFMVHCATRLGITSAILLAMPSITAAQGRERLPIAGSVSWQLLFYNDPPEGAATNYARFQGRIAVPIAQFTYVGLAVGSWARDGTLEAPNIPNDVLASRSEAVLNQIFIQHIPNVLNRVLFARLGTGLARTETFLPAGGTIDRYAHWRVLFSAGTGVELPVARFVYLAASLDMSVLLDADTETAELRNGLGLGIGLSIR